MGRHLLIISGLLLVCSCNKSNNKTIKYGYHFFPITEGQYVVYDVIDVFHDSALTIPHDTSLYQIKEIIGEEYEDEEGDAANKLYRYYRQNDTMIWTIQDAWSIKRTKRNGEIVEENDRRIKMTFAISYDQEWNCNALNDEEEQNCHYAEIYKPFSLGGIDFDSTVIVEHQDFTSYIQYLRSYAVYAPNIGCIYRVDKNLNINYQDTLNIHYGTEMIYSAVGWGIE